MQTQTLQKNITYDELLDAVEVEMHKQGLVDITIIHMFTPGLYTRSMVDVPPGTYLLSHIHKTEHQFIMSKGQIVIYTEDEGMKIISAPYLNKTRPGTRRFAQAYDHVTWTSIHATDIQPKDDSVEAFEEAVRLVEAELFEKHQNIFLINKEAVCQL